MPDEIPTPLHFSCYWNLDGEFNPHAPEGMRIWAENLRSFEERGREEQYTWYGKLSFSNLGIPSSEIKLLNDKIQTQNENNVETRLYLYTFFNFNKMKVPYSLHVAKVTELRDQSVYDDNKEREHIPLDFYDSVLKQEKLSERYPSGQAIPFFFKIKDLRELNISHSQNLQKAIQANSYNFIKFRWDDTLSPAYIREIQPYNNWFDDSKAWWKEVLKTGDDLDPGKFKSDSMKEIYYRALQYSSINSPILIVGERGAGKTHLARFIRRNSKYCQDKYSTDWPLISCAEFNDPVALESRIFGEDNVKKLYGETLVLDDMEYAPRFIVRKILSKFELDARSNRESEQEFRSFRFIGCASISPHELNIKLDPRLLDATATILEVPPLSKLEDDDRKTVWKHQYEHIRRRLFPNEDVAYMNASEEIAFLKRLYRSPLRGNFRDLQSLATKVLLELKFRETISDESAETTLNPDKIFSETLSPYPFAGKTDREKVENLAWAFITNSRLEYVHEVTDFESLQELRKALVANIEAYLGKNIKRLRESGHESASKIWKDKYDTINRWAKKEKDNEGGADKEIKD